MTYTQWVHTEPYSSWFQTLFQLVQGKMCSRWFQTLFQLVQGKMCLISSDLIAFPLVRLSASSTRVLRLLVRLGRCWSQQMTYIQWVHAEPLQLVQGTEQVLPVYEYLRRDCRAVHADAINGCGQKVMFN